MAARVRPTVVVREMEEVDKHLPANTTHPYTVEVEATEEPLLMDIMETAAQVALVAVSREAQYTGLPEGRLAVRAA